jgi:hypothetical protein
MRSRKKLGGLYRQRGSPNWYADYVDSSGRRRRRSTGKTTKKEAERVRARWLNERSQPECEPSFAEMRADMLADYEALGRKSWKRVEQALAHVQPAFGSLRASQITARKLTAYRNARREQHAR